VESDAPVEKSYIFPQAAWKTLSEFSIIITTLTANFFL
jgi:hypothetical protein